MKANEIIDLAVSPEPLGFQAGKEFLRLIAKNEINSEQIAAILTAQRIKTPSSDFLLGLRQSALELATKIDLPKIDSIDVCGTGGDGKNSFNISTATAILLAAAGMKVIKHGNYGSSSSCGSSNVIEALGYKFSNDSSKLAKELEENNIIFLHAPLFHPVFKEVSAIRKNLGFRTFFNLLGPLVNPARPSHQLIGVAEYSNQKLLSNTLAKTEVQFAIIHSLDGYDEISLTSSFTVKGTQGEELIDPRELGFGLLTADQIASADSSLGNAKLLIDLFSRKGTRAQEQVVSVNAAAAMRLVKPELSWMEAIDQASYIMQSDRPNQLIKKILA